MSRVPRYIFTEYSIGSGNSCTVILRASKNYNDFKIGIVTS